MSAGATGGRPRVLIDAGPTENTHRGRGIGTVARQVLAAVDASIPATLGLDVSYLRRTPLPEGQLGDGVGAWVQRSRSADWTGIAPGVSPRTANWWQVVDAVGPMSREVAASGADVVLALDPHAIPLGAGFRTVAVLYDVVPLVFPAQYLGGRTGQARRWLYRHRLRRMRRAHHVVAISEAARADAIRLAGFEASRVSVAPLAVDHAAFDRAAATASIAEMRQATGIESRYLLYVGECDARKNVPLLLDAFLRLAGEVSGVELVMAGACATSARPMRDRVADHARAARVRWVGHVPDALLPALFAGAQAFVFPSRYEGFGLPVLEAMSCGTPVVTSRLSSLPEVAGDAALYVNVDDVEDLVAGMRRLLLEPALRAALAEKGQRRAREFTWTRTARALLEACARTAQGSAGPS
jgi:glycosyltransferase involved in cell wall biosynthesis